MWSDNSDTLFTVLSSVDLQTVNGGEQIQAEVAPPFGSGVYLMDNVPVITDGGRFYDSGGPNGNYTREESYVKYFYPEVAGNKLRMFSSMIDLHDRQEYWQNQWQRDRIITSNADGSNSQTIDYTENTTTNDWSFTSTDPTGGIRVHFISVPNNYLNSGWEFNIESLNQPVTLVDWNVVGTSKHFDLYYSVDNGLSWEMIVTNYHSPTGSYS